MQNYQKITITKNRKLQNEPLQSLKKEVFLYEWTFIFEKKHSNIFGNNILEGISFKNKWLPKGFSKSFYITFFNDDKGTYLRNSFSKNKSSLYVPYGEKIGIKMYIDEKTNKLYSIISSTFSDEGIADDVSLGIYKIPFKNIGMILHKKSNKNLIIQTNNNI